MSEPLNLYEIAAIIGISSEKVDELKHQGKLDFITNRNEFVLEEMERILQILKGNFE